MCMCSVVRACVCVGLVGGVCSVVRVCVGVVGGVCRCSRRGV